MKTLIVDDNKENLYLLETILKGSGYEVASAANGAEALEKLRAERFGMIVSDILMPVMDGFQLCREVKGDEELKDIPFVFYTATYTDEKDEELALKMGADKFIRKPTEPDEFIKLIQGVIRDAEKGKAEPAKPVVEEEKEVFKLYSERLIAKLEKKMLNLEAEIVERKRAEEKVRHLNQILQLVRRINQLIIQVDNESELLQKACDRLIDGRNYKMAWIGFTQEGSYDIMPVAQAGFEEGYLSSVKITWDDSEYGRGPTGMAIKTGYPSVMRDILNDERYRPWRDEALKRGYTSSVALPLTIENKVIGALNVYSGYPDAFDDAEISLLVELAGDISLGVEKIRLREVRKRAEEQIKQLQEYLQLQVERMPIGLIVWDTEFRVQAWNPAAEKIFGFTAEEALGKHPYDLIVPKEAQAHVDNIWRQLLKGDMTAHSINENITKDGRTIICDWSNTPLTKADGTVLGILSMVQDITELKRAEEDLIIAEQNFRHSLDNSPLGGCIVTAEGELLYANQAMLDIYDYNSVEELKNTPIKERYTPKSYAEFHKRREKRKQGKPAPDSYEVSIIRKDGEVRYLIASRKPVVWNGEIHYQTLYQDITERKQAEEKAREVETLKEIDRLRSGLLANVSHELRTPLTSIKGFATTLLRSDVKWSEEEQRDFLQSIDHETDRLIRLISDLLDMSRIEAEGLKLEKHNYQISEILDSAGSRLASLTERHQLQVIVPSGLPSVFVDQMRIGQVLTNLVENATKYSKEGSLITIEAQLAGDQINVSVTDRGKGIPAKLLDRVFDRFYQAESIVTGRESGTGLGLSICRGIIEAHGGRIWVESKLGKGSKFSFSLPVGKGEEEVD